MGGSDDVHNLVALTAREHFIAHWLLWKIHKNKQMAHAFHMMSKYAKSSYAYAATKQAIGQAMQRNQRAAGAVRSPEVREKIRQARLGTKRSEETKRKISQSKKGTKYAPITEEGINNKRLAHLGKKHSEESRRKMSESKKGIPSPKKGKKLKPHSEETKQKMREAHARRKANK